MISTERVIELRDRYTVGKDSLRHAPEEVFRTGRDMAQILDNRIAEEVNMRHEVILTRDESGRIVAECPDLPGCVSQGNNEAEALANIREAMAGWFWAEEQKAKDRRLER